MGDQECKVEEAMQRLIAMAEQLLPKVEDVKAEEMGDMVEGEMMETSLAIEKAAAKIAVGFISCLRLFILNLNMFWKFCMQIDSNF